MDVNEEMKFFVKIKNKNSGGGGGGVGSGVRIWGSERRCEVFVKIQNQRTNGGRVGGQGGSEKFGGCREDPVGSGQGVEVRVDLNKELKFL